MSKSSVRFPRSLNRLFAAAVLLLVAATTGAELPPPQRDLRFVMSDLSYAYPDANNEVDASALIGVDELWIAYTNERGGTARLVDLLRRAKSRGSPKVVLGLAAPQDLGYLQQHPVFWQNQYLDPYVDASLDISPRSAPLGFFLGSQTGRDDPNADLRRASVRSDPPGLLVNDAYYTFVSPTLDKDAGGNIGARPRTYRFRFPLLAGSDLASVPPGQRVATLTIVSADSNTTVYAQRIILAGDLLPLGGWKMFDLFVDSAVAFDKIDIEVDWDAVADLTLGTIRRDHWDPASNQTMLAAIDAGIVRAEPTAKYGHNIFDFLDALHADVVGQDPLLFDSLAGFWLLDEPSCYGHAAWRRIADQLRAYFGSRSGYGQARLFVNFSSGDDVNPLSRFYKSGPVAECMKFGAPVYSFDFYMWELYDGTLPREGTAYQNDGIEWPLTQWRPKAAACRAGGIPCQNFIDIRGVKRTPSPAEVSLQVWLSLALAFDRVAFWEITSASWPLLGPPSPARLTDNGKRVRELITALRKLKPTYDQLGWIDAYSTRQLDGHYVKAIEDARGIYPPGDLWAEVGEFGKGSHRYLLLVNRHTTAADTIDFKVTLDIPAGPAWTLVDVTSGQLLGKVTSSAPTMTLSIAPGSGSLVGVLPGSTGDLNHDNCVDRTDLALLMAAIRLPDPQPQFDLNDDGRLDLADARLLTQLYSRPSGSPCR